MSYYFKVYGLLLEYWLSNSNFVDFLNLCSDKELFIFWGISNIIIKAPRYIQQPLTIISLVSSTHTLCVCVWTDNPSVYSLVNWAMWENSATYYHWWQTVLCHVKVCITVKSMWYPTQWYCLWYYPSSELLFWYHPCSK